MAATAQESETEEELPDSALSAEEEQLESATISSVEEEDFEVVEVIHAPPRIGQIIAIVAAFLGMAITAPFTVLAIPFGLAGIAIFIAAMTAMQSRGWLTVGTGLILLGAILTGSFGVLTPEIMLMGVGLVLIGWDAGQHAITLGNQLGRQTRSHRNQLVHTAFTALAVGIIGGILFGIYQFAGDGRPAPAVAIMIVGIIFTAWLLRK